MQRQRAYLRLSQQTGEESDFFTHIWYGKWKNCHGNVTTRNLSGKYVHIYILIYILYIHM